MKKFAMITMIGVLMVGLFTGCATDTSSDTSSDPSTKKSSTVSPNPLFSDMNTMDIYEAPITSDVFADKELTLVAVWATFCGPCIRSIPVYEEIYQEYADQGVGVVGLLIDTSTPKPSAGLSDGERDLGQSLLADAGATYPQLTLSEDMLQTELGKINQYPTAYFVDSTGSVVGDSILGANAKGVWDEKIKSHLEMVRSHE